MIAQTDALSALAWWQLAGVDSLVEEDIRDWLQPARPVPSAAAPAAEAAPTPSDGADLPQSLEAYRGWLATAPHPALPAGPRILPSGSAASGLMLLCGQPELADRETLLEGAPGRLLDAMLAAIGFDRETSYLASLCPGHLPGRMAAAAQQHLGELTLHHVELAAPKALLLLGDHASQALLGGPVAATRGRLHEINHSRGKVMAVATFHPRLLLATPARKADAWQDLRLLLGILSR